MATRRRGKGEGTVRQRADGRWEARVDLGWQDGKRRRKAVYGKTRRGVASKLTKVLRDAQQGAVVTDERETLAKFLARWLEVKRGQLRPRSWASYDDAVRLSLVPGLGRFTLARLTPQHVATWMTEAQKNGTSARSIRYARVVLRAALNQARKWQLLSQNAAALADPPRHTAREIQPLTPDKARTWIDHVRTHRLAALFTVAVAVGLRIGEALGLRWIDIDLERGTLAVRQALERSGGDPVKRRALLAERTRLKEALVAATMAQEKHEFRNALEALRKELKPTLAKVRFVEPKSQRSRRTIELPSVVVTALKQHRKRQLEDRMAAGEDWKDSGLAFTTPIGTPLEHRNVTREFKALLNRAGLPNVRLHDLRHSCATLLLSQHVDQRTIMSVLGHSQISLTLNTYSHVVPALQVEAANKIDAVLKR